MSRLVFFAFMPANDDIIRGSSSSRGKLLVGPGPNSVEVSTSQLGGTA